MKRKEILKNALFQQLQAEDYETAFWKLLSVFECGDMPCSECPVAVVLLGKRTCPKLQLMSLEKHAKKEIESV